MADQLSKRYQMRKTGYENDLLREKRQGNLLSLFRLIVFLTTIGLIQLLPTWVRKSWPNF